MQIQLDFAMIVSHLMKSRFLGHLLSKERVKWHRLTVVPHPVEGWMNFSGEAFLSPGTTEGTERLVQLRTSNL